MPTYLEVQQRIADDLLNRSDFNAQIKNHIQATIRRYQRERFWFNETSTILTCVRSVETVAVPSDFLFLQNLYVTQNSSDTELVPTAFADIRRLNVDTSVGLPTRFVKYGDNFHLANVPDSAYPLPCYYIQQIPALSADTSTNAWLSAAEDVIVFGAATRCWAMTIRNASAAAVCAQYEQAAISELRREAQQHLSLKIKATRF